MKRQEEIREKVRQTYGNIALQGSEVGDVRSCCDTPQPENQNNQAGCGCGCGQGELNADQVAALLGYSQMDLKNVPAGANLGLGCGNPQAIASISPGECVVDLGSGGGFDCFLAARQVGLDGHVIGVDMTPEMISRARMNKEKACVENVEFRLGEIEHLPVEDNVADLIISNCVINLSPDKAQVYRDAFRVLKPGGRLAVSDMVALKPLPESIQKDLALVSACIGGAATIEDTRTLLEQAGFENVTITARKLSDELVNSFLPGSPAAEYVDSADIQAVKTNKHKPKMS